MSETVLSNIETEIFELPVDEQLKLISRVAETLRKRVERDNDHDALLAEMAVDPDIQKELKEIEKDFRITEFDGLSG